MQFYLNPEQEQEPDAEVIAVAGGWSWRLLGEVMDLIGPFDTQADAIADAQGGAA